MQNLLISNGNLIISSFNDRPGKLFEGLEHIRLSIILLNRKGSLASKVFTTKYNKWQTVARPFLFNNISFVNSTKFIIDGSFPKLSLDLERSILNKIYNETKNLEIYSQKAGNGIIYYTRKLSGFVQVLNFIPAIFDATGHKRNPSELKDIKFDSEIISNIFLGLLNSNLFFWWLTIYSDCRNLNKREVNSIPFNIEKASKSTIEKLCYLAQKLMNDFQANSKLLEMKYENLGKMKIQCIYPKHSKDIIDEIDRVLAVHYGFTDEELDFIINYDIKYRMGRDSVEE